MPQVRRACFRESDSSIVPKKQANKGGLPTPAESVEGRGLTEENAQQSLPDRTQAGLRVARLLGRTIGGIS